MTIAEYAKFYGQVAQLADMEERRSISSEYLARRLREILAECVRVECEANSAASKCEQIGSEQ